MDEFLREAKNQRQVLNDIEKELKINVTEFKNVELDFFSVVLFGNFERDLNSIIESKMSVSNNFNRNYIKYLQRNRKMHSGLSGGQLKEFIKVTFNLNITEFLTEKEWEVYKDFMEYRHAVAHSLPSYNSKKNKLLSNINSIDELVSLLEKILLKLKQHKRISIA